MYGDSPELAVGDLTFACVDAGPHIQPDSSERVDYGAAAANCARGSVEGCEEAVSSGVDLPPSIAGQLRPDDRVVGVQQLPPGPITQLGGALGGRNNIGEKDSRQYSVEVGRLPDPGEETVNVRNRRVQILAPWDVIAPVDLDERGVGDRV